MARPSRHTSFGGRADAAPDSPQAPAKPPKQETPAAARMRRMRALKRDRAVTPVTPLLRSVTQTVTNVTRNVTPTQTQDVTRNVTPVTPVTPKVSRSVTLDQLRASLPFAIVLDGQVVRVTAIEGVEAAVVAPRPQSTGLCGNIMQPTTTPAERAARVWPGNYQSLPAGVRPGDTVTIMGRTMVVPVVDADGQAIPA